MPEVVVLGNIAIDETLAVSELPKAGASVAARALSNDIGGKGLNQALACARALAAMGMTGKTQLVAALGRDARGAAAKAALADEPLDLKILERNLASDWSVILRDALGENTIVTTQDCAKSIEPDEAVALTLDSKILILQGNLKPETSLAALKAAGKRGVLRILNPSPVEGCTDAMLRQTDILVVNEGEALHFGGVTALSRHALVVQTLGAKGVALWREGQCIAKSQAESVAVKDPTGAGDCFLGTLAARLYAGDKTQPDLADLAYAAWSAGLTVSRLGTKSAFPSIAEYQAALG